MSDKITELGAHKPSVTSVISRLDRHQDKIKHITAIIEWEDGSGDIHHDTVGIETLCYDSVILNKYVADLVSGGGSEPESEE